MTLNGYSVSFNHDRYDDTWVNVSVSKSMTQWFEDGSGFRRYPRYESMCLTTLYGYGRTQEDIDGKLIETIRYLSNKLDILEQSLIKKGEEIKNGRKTD
jgi:hypothetical protein